MKIHFIAIGGSAMHNLALALHHQGNTITGSDDAIFEPSKSRLAKYDLLPAEIGWYPEKITQELDAVILGMHAHPDNPELAKAQELQIPIYSYPEFLYEQSKDKTRVVIAGSHGKTTITSMILHVCNYHKRDVDFMVGAQLEGYDTMVNLTDDNPIMILEGDEYLSSPIDRRSKFLHYKPNIALISGIAWDHINVFPTYEEYLAPFQEFIETISEGGALVFNAEDKEVVQLQENAQKYLKKYPYTLPEFENRNGKTFLKTELGEVPLLIFGRHNLSNLAGAKEICLLLGFTEEEFYEAISTFKGASRRLEFVKETPEYIVYKDFAHSPSKVEATTLAVREQFPNRNFVASLELHTYSSLTPEFLKEYAHTLDAADIPIVFYSPKALEIKRREPISPDEIKQYFDNDQLQVATSKEELEEILMKTSKENSVYLMMSSGNFGGLDLEDL